MTEFVWNNLVSYSLQVGILIAIAGCVPALLRLRQPKARLLFWRFALAAVILLPAIRPWRSEAVSAEVHVSAGPVIHFTGHPTPTRAPIPWEKIAICVVALGVGCRLALLGAGFWKLSRYRRRSTPLPGGPNWSNVQILVCSEIEGPVTFGFLSPVILLPERFPGLDASTREAVLHHEMLHVARFDWLFTVGEELVRAALWFHPAVWWLLAEVQLTREQAVDHEVIAATNASEQYVDALLTIARAETALDLAPAFLRRRQLKARVVSILKESRMPDQKVSRSRSVFSMALAAAVLAGACWTVTATFPLRAQTRTVYDDYGVSVDTFGATLQHRTSILYPQTARDKRVEGTVVAQVRLSDSGTVEDAQILSGPDELRNVVLRSVLEFHFARELGGTVRQVAVAFKLAATAGPGSVVGGPVSGTASPGSRPVIVASNQGLSINKYNFQDGILTDEQKARITAIAPVGTRISNEIRDRVTSAVQEIDEHYMVSFMGNGENGLTLLVMMRPASVRLVPGQVVEVQRSSVAPPQNVSAGATDGVVSAPPPPPMSLNGVQPSVEGPVTIGGRVQSAKLINHVDPIYPTIAKTARISGKVILQAVIAPDGTIQSLAVISGHPMLQQAALQAVRQWVYAPTYLNNQPVTVQTTIEVNFSLSQ